MADLETLTNKELHNLCIEKGLPNIPVTDTSRKIIIKRLTNAMAEEKKEKAKSRRETIHVIHVEKEEEAAPKKPSKSSGRRTTIGAAQAAKEAKQPDPPVVVEKSEPVKNRRRSARASPLPESNEPVKSGPKHSSKAPVIEEDEEDDIMIVEDDDARRKSRSPSLTKSEVVRTYFKSSVVAEPVVEVQNGEVDEEYSPLPPTVISRRPRFSPTPTTKISPAKSTTITRSNVEQTTFDDNTINPVLERKNLERHYEESSSRKSYLYPDLRESFQNAYEDERNSYLEGESRSKADNLYEEKVRKSSYEEKPSYLSRETTVYASQEVPSYLSRHSTAYYDKERVSNLYSTNAKPSESYPSYSRNYEDKNAVTTTQTTNRRLVSNFYPESNYSSSGGANKRKAYAEQSDEYDDEEENNDEPPQIEAPHFQDFARRISVLREQEISSILNKDTKPKDYRSRYDYRYPSTYRKNEGVMDRMVSYWRVLDKKYNVSFYLIVVGIILALAFVYIFFSN